MAPIKVLVLTANPHLPDQAPLRLDAEVRQIEEALQRAQQRDRFDISTQLATRTTDLRRALLDHRPQIVHFSGHGTGERGLVLETEAGQKQLVRTEAITQLFEAFSSGEIECVLLNACYSEVQAVAIHQFVDCVIGMNQPIGDRAAQQFSEGFYDALGAGKPYDEAFKIGCSAIALDSSSDAKVPVLKYRKRPSMVAPSPEPAPSSEKASADSQAPPAQSQSIGNVTISGSQNPFSAVQAGGNVTVDWSQTQTQANPDVQQVLVAVRELNRAIANSDELDETEKAMAAIPVQKLKAELQKPEPNPSVVEKMVTMIQKTLEGAIALANPVATLATLAAKAWVGLR